MLNTFRNFSCHLALHCYSFNVAALKQMSKKPIYFGFFLFSLRNVACANYALQFVISYFKKFWAVSYFVLLFYQMVNEFNRLLQCFIIQSQWNTENNFYCSISFRFEFRWINIAETHLDNNYFKRNKTV